MYGYTALSLAPESFQCFLIRLAYLGVILRKNDELCVRGDLIENLGGFKGKLHDLVQQIEILSNDCIPGHLPCLFHIPAYTSAMKLSGLESQK